MTERIKFTTGDGQFDALVYRPVALPAPGVLIIPEVFGRSIQLRDMAAEFVRAGFLVGILDIHWRLEPEVALAPHEVERARSLHQRLDYELAMADITTAIEQFRRLPECTGKIAVVGFCLGGTLSWRAAARTAADAAVSYYGTRIPKYIEETPKSPLLLHLGEADHFTPPEVIALIEKTIEGQGSAERFRYPGAGHAFCNPAQQGFEPEAAALAHRRSMDFLHRHLSSTQHL
jgi:carboxymethylenebutenolidase